MAEGQSLSSIVTAGYGDGAEGHCGFEPMTPHESTMLPVGRHRQSTQPAEFSSTIERRPASTRGLLSARSTNRPPLSDVRAKLDNSTRPTFAEAVVLNATWSTETSNTLDTRPSLMMNTDRKPATIKLGAFTGSNVPL
jgi:hypothetical protein